MGGWHLAHKIQTEPTILMRLAVVFVVKSMLKAEENLNFAS